MARRIGLRSEDADSHSRAAPKSVVVKWSARAAILAGLITACLTAGGLLIQDKTGADGGDLAQASALFGFNAQSLAPALLLASLWEAGQATFWTLVTSHFVLRRIEATSLFAYASASALAGAAWAGASQVLGFGAPDHGYVAQIAIGACAGFFYRLLAGAKPAA
jgi:hypothetical protein